MSKKLKVAQIGVGGFGGYRRQRMRETGLFELVACYDLNEQAMAQCRQEDGARPVSSYEELFNVSGIEAVIISTGAKFHAEQIIKAAEKGLHVFVEKPLCSTQDEVRTLLDIYHKTGVVIVVGHADHTCNKVSLTINRMIRSGEMGAIATFEKTTCHSGAKFIKQGAWRGDPDKNPGGMLFQCGVHGIHELIFYFGPVKRVWSVMRSDVYKATRTVDVALCHLEFASGLVGTLNAYHVTPYRHTFSIFGTKMNIYRDGRFFDEGTLLFTQTACEDREKEPIVPLQATGDDDICGNLRSFYRAVRDGGEPYPSLLDGGNAVLPVFAAEESAKTGKMVELSNITASLASNNGD